MNRKTKRKETRRKKNDIRIWQKKNIQIEDETTNQINTKMTTIEQSICKNTWQEYRWMRWEEEG